MFDEEWFFILLIVVFVFGVFVATKISNSALKDDIKERAQIMRLWDNSTIQTIVCGPEGCKEE